MNRFHHWFCRTAVWRKQLERTAIPWLMQSDFGNHVLEIGPGPGLVTDFLCQQAKSVTAIEIDPVLARSLRKRFTSSNVDVVEGDATQMNYADNSFSSAACFTMLHHVPSVQLQDKLFAEVSRVIKPGGCFVGTDSYFRHKWDPFHAFDTLVPVNPSTLAARLEAAGFNNISVETRGRTVYFRAYR